jgi:C_GCAxxG_C_C family probable redox protein
MSQETARALAEKAIGYFDAGYNCAESTLRALAEHWGLDDDGVPCAAVCFGGGIGRSGGVCGALTGSLMAAGLKCGPRDPADGSAKERAYTLAAVTCGSFLREMGALDCRDITGCELSTPEGMAYFRERRLHDMVCKACVRSGITAVLSAVASQEG